MTDTSSTNNQEKSQKKDERNIFVNVQYIKDFSFENPNSPQSLLPQEEAPKINVGVDVKINKLDESNFEVLLNTNAEAKHKDTLLFVAELSYAGIFSLNIPEEEHEPALLIYCPSLLFPFARQIISEATRQGGFPPLLIDPIDFASLYKEHKSHQKETIEETT